MLFTDGPFVTAQSLNVIDNEFITLAGENGIVVDGSSDSFLAHVILACGSEFISLIQNFSGYLVGVGVGSNHLAAVLNVLSTAINRPRAFLQQIPVMEPDPTRSSFIRWVRYRCLEDFYKSIYLQQTREDRFELKYLLFKKEAEVHWRRVIGTGFPVVMNPLSAPGAVWDYGAGTWGAANVQSVVGTAAGGTFNVVITWVNSPQVYVSPANQNGGESGPSSTVSIVVASSHVLQVNINGLNPPNGSMQTAIGTAQGVYPPQPATGWNIYVGAATGPLYLQNATPIPIATTSFTLPANPIINFSQSQLNMGQPAQYDFSFKNMIWRG